MSRAPVSLLVHGARLWSRHARIDADAIAVAGATIVAVGRRAEIEPLAGARTRRVDAAGATLTPALTDAHLHLHPWALALTQPDLHGARTREEALARLAAAGGRAADDLLVGRGWDDARWPEPPTRAVLDAAFPSRPIVLHRHDFHAVWFNGAAMRAAGVDAAAADPTGGAFSRDARGRLAGVAAERATLPFRELERARVGLAPEVALERAAAVLHAEGITAVHDFDRDAVTFAANRTFAARRRLRILQQIGPEWFDAGAAGPPASGDGDDWFRVGGLKLFADGTLGSRTAALLAPYDDAAGSGMDVMSAGELAELVARAAAAGVATAIHAIGDRAVRHALDAFAAVPSALRRAMPNRVEHVQLVHAQDVPRFAELGVVASVQPTHLVSDAPGARRAWGRRGPGAYAWAALARAGARLAFGSDAPVEPPGTAAMLAAALERRGVDGEVFHPENAVGLDAALHAAITVPAALAGRDVTLAPGAVADLVLWDRDLHGVPPGHWHGVRARLTVLGGEIVHDAEDGAPSGASGRIA